MFLEPGGEVERVGAVQGQRVAVELIGHDNEVVVCGELVGY